MNIARRLNRKPRFAAGCIMLAEMESVVGLFSRIGLNKETRNPGGGKDKFSGIEHSPTVSVGNIQPVKRIWHPPERFAKIKDGFATHFSAVTPRQRASPEGRVMSNA